jgi:hypothetical protein
MGVAVKLVLAAHGGSSGDIKNFTGFTDGSKDVVWRKDVPSECSKCCNQLLGIQNPQNCASREIPAKIKTSINAG